MSKFKPGDLVTVVSNTAYDGCPNFQGSVGTIIDCNATAHARMHAYLAGEPYYRTTITDEGVFREDALKLIGGERPTTEVDETRDEPVHA